MGGKVWVISGPSGVGKSTTSARVAQRLENSVLLSGDLVSEMHINGRLMPWEDEGELELIWKNISDLTRNFLQYGLNVVVDYVTFPREMKKFWESLQNDKSHSVMYVILWANKEEIIRRDLLRTPDRQMKERSIIHYDEFSTQNIPKNFYLNNMTLTVDQAIDAILDFPPYKPFCADLVNELEL